MLGNCLGPGRGPKLPASHLVWHTAGSPLPKQPSEVGQWGEEAAKLRRPDTGRSVVWRSRLSFVVRVQGSVDMLHVGKAAASPGVLKHHAIPDPPASLSSTSFPSCPSPCPGTPVPTASPLGLAWLSLWLLGFNLSQESLRREGVKSERGSRL